MQGGEDLRGRHAVLRRRRVINPYLDLRRQHLLLNFEVGDARDGGDFAAQHVGLPAQCVEVVTEYLDGDLRAHAGEHVVDPVRDGLSDGDGRRQVGQAAADVGRDFSHRPGQFGSRFEPDIEFADMDPFGMLVEFGPAATPADVDHLGHGLDQHLGLPG